MHPIVAAIASFIIPGLGQAISGDIKKGIIFFVVALIISVIAFFVFKNIIFNIINIIIALYAAYDAYQMNVM